MRLSWLSQGVICMSLLTSLSAHAYTILDQATLSINLPPQWQFHAITRNPNMIITTYSNDVTHETFVEAAITKHKGTSNETDIDNMMTSMEQQARSQHCDVIDALHIPQKNGLFSVWTQTFQCKRSKSAILQVYVDTDTKTLYSFTYTKQAYPFTFSMRDAVNHFLKNTIAVCYEGKECAPLY